jgi:hypothetical protein
MLAIDILLVCTQESLEELYSRKRQGMVPTLSPDPEEVT